MKLIRNILLPIKLSFTVKILCFFVFALQGCNVKKSTDLLTIKEREWLNNYKDTITLAVENSYAPFAFIDENGKATGIANDYIELIESKLNIRFNRVKVKTLNEILLQAQQKNVDIVNAVTESPNRSKFLLFTKPFIVLPSVIIVRNDISLSLDLQKMQGVKISLVKDYIITEYVLNKYKNLDTAIVPDDLTALLNVSFNKTDAAIIDLATASYLIEKNGITNLRIAGEIDFKYKLAIASRKDLPILHNILEKGLSAIDENERKAIKTKWISLGQSSLFEKIEFWISIVTALFIFSIILFWNFSLKKLVENRTIQLQNELSERKRAEQALKLETARRQTIFDQSPDGIVILNPGNAHFLEFNTAAHQQLGYSREEFSKLSVPDIEAKETAEETFSQIADVIKNGYAEFETLHKKKDGSIRNVHVKAKIINTNGHSTYHCIWRDVTESRYAEMELEKHRNHLDELVKERTAILDSINANLTFVIEKKIEAEEKLEKALENEKQLSELKNRFISTASHEFRTPLTSILSSTELLQRYRNKWTDEKKDEHVDRIRRQIEYLTKMLNDVLSINRAESGKEIFNPVCTDLFNLCNKVMEDLQVLVTSSQSLLLKYNTNSNLFTLDSNKIELILTNLLSNAIKYSPNGGKIDFEVNLKDNLLQFSISDQGIGIPELDIPRLFEPFHRSQNSMNIKGTGLGLSIVKHAVDLHRGTIIVDSKEGVGSTFTVTIPITVTA